MTNNIPDEIESSLNLFDFELIDLDDKILRGILESHFLDLRTSIYRYFDELNLIDSFTDFKQTFISFIDHNYPDDHKLIDFTVNTVNEFEIELIQTIHTGN